MAMGPLYSCVGQADMDRLLAAVRAAGIRVTSDSTRRHAYWFRHGLGLVHGSNWQTCSALYFGFGHPFNPFLWRADSRLLADIGAVLKANGSRLLAFEDIEESDAQRNDEGD